MKKFIAILASISIVLALSVAVSAAKITSVPLELHSTVMEESVLSVSGSTVSVSDINGKGVTLVSNSAMYNAAASIHDGFIIKISNIVWDASNKNGIMIYVSPTANGTVVNTAPNGLALYVNKGGNAYVWTNVKNGFNPNAHPLGKWTDLFAEKADALADNATSFYYSVLPLDNSNSQYGVFVTSSVPVVGTSTPIYTYNTTWTDATGGGGFDGTADTLFNAAKNDSKTFNFSFQIWADGALSWGDGITTIPTAGSLSYKVESIDLLSVKGGSNDNPDSGDAFAACAVIAIVATAAMIGVKKHSSK